MNDGQCPSCGAAMMWDNFLRTWVCECGQVYTEDELEEERRQDPDR